VSKTIAAGNEQVGELLACQRWRFSDTKALNLEIFREFAIVSQEAPLATTIVDHN
jgi:hypothetical protein